MQTEPPTIQSIRQAAQKIAEGFGFDPCVLLAEAFAVDGAAGLPDIDRVGVVSAIAIDPDEAEHHPLGSDEAISMLSDSSRLAVRDHGMAGTDPPVGFGPLLIDGNHRTIILQCAYRE